MRYSDGSFAIVPDFPRGKAHKGADLPGPVGAPVHAAADGVVVVVSTEHKKVKVWAKDKQGQLLLNKQGKPYKIITRLPEMAGYGHYIIVRHPDGYTTRYAHLREQPNLKVGAPVRMGQEIGTLGKTGNAAKMGSHVHFEVRDKYDHPIDPAIWINGRAPLLK